MRYKMIALDLDGTLTNSDKVITPATKAALFQFQENGGRIILASGRPTCGITPLAEELELENYGGYILSYNGAKVVNCENNQLMYNKTMSLELVEELDALAKKHKVNIMTYEDRYIYTLDKSEPYVNVEQQITKMELKEVDNLAKAVSAPVNKCLMTGEPEYLMEVEEKIKEEMGGRINVYRSQPFFLELVPKNIDKAESLDSLLEQLELDRQHLIACGDGYNDLSMIRYAGLGVAMSNGEEGVKEEADYIAPSNDEDGIADVLEKFVFFAA